MILVTVNVLKWNLFKRMIDCYYDVHKWLDDVEDEQMSFLIWEMHQSHWEKL